MQQIPSIPHPVQEEQKEQHEKSFWAWPSSWSTPHSPPGEISSIAMKVLKLPCKLSLRFRSNLHIILSFVHRTGSPIKQIMGWLHWDNFSFIIILLIKSNNSMECPFSVHTPWTPHELWEQMQFSVQKCWHPQHLPAMKFPFFGPKRATPTLCQCQGSSFQSILWECVWERRKGLGSARGVLCALPNPADHLPQVKQF